MSVAQLLKDITARGLTISLADADLRLQGPRERIDADLVSRIRQRKPELIAHLRGQAGDQAARFPLTPLQRSYLIGRSDVFDLGNVASQVYHEIEGVWDINRLEIALAAVVNRHPGLRSRFPAEDVQVEQQSPLAVTIAQQDLRGESPAVQEQRLAKLREQRSHLVLPADRAPLLDVAVTVLTSDRMVMHVSHDGLIMDGISMFLFFRAWWQAYQGNAGEDPGELPFHEYVDARKRSAGQPPVARSKAYWMSRLDDFAPRPDLPLRTNPAEITYPRFRQREVRLDAAGWVAVRAHAAAAGLTPSALLLTAYAETLSTWGAGERFTVNTTVAHRPPIHPRIFDAIGQFSDTILVELSVDRSTTFRERARTVQARLHQDLDNRHFSGVEVLRELGRRGESRAQYTFNSAIGHPQPDVDGSTLELFGKEVYSVSQTPQVWLNAFAMEQHGGLVVQLDGVDALYDEGLLDALADGYRSLLEQLRDESRWNNHSFDLLPADQRRRRQQANDTAAQLLDETLTDAFIAHATANPEAPAVISGAETVSYGELYRRVRHAASWLRARRLHRDELVGLVMTRGPEQVVGILATVLAGGAYLPVDAGLPAERRAYLLRDGQVRMVLTNVGYAADEPDTDVLDLTREVTGDPPPVEPLPDADLDDLAYVLYTSGTTGQPKGVMVSRRSLLNVITDCNRRFRVGPADRFFAISAFNFDLSVYDVFGALSAGAALVQPDADRAADPAHWLHLCATAGVTLWNSVPAIVSLVHEQAVADGAEPLARLRLVMMSGDRIPPALPPALRKLRPGLEVVSLGGPTETTIWNILYPIEPDGGEGHSIPYGWPNANNRAYVLDRNGLDVPDWVTGEICAAGVGLARGYWRDETRTAERFWYDEQRADRIYRTGDLGRYLPDGSIAILGRSDFQIKINGYRIEAGEVETRLVDLDGVRQSVVVRQDGVGGVRLVAHLVSDGIQRPDEDQLRRALRVQLPEYMVPSLMVWHDELPLTRNGKVDRSRLSATVVKETPTGPATVARGRAADVEAQLADLWMQILGVAMVDLGATIYELGGDSIAAARILTAVRKRYGVSIPLARLPEMETVRAMAAHLLTLERLRDD
ncbi:non-ribosomal peptide synthetase [Salinispora oceanensis]|uniref:non-ribosomal peptide synthetase n=1 Tax=Salinispora oceanensis TaxID=1050199 RepID=UPI00036A8462|nr:non-ribosomal peptide synthetase [Salinispora oceanensis]